MLVFTSQDIIDFVYYPNSKNLREDEKIEIENKNYSLEEVDNLFHDLFGDDSAREFLAEFIEWNNKRTFHDVIISKLIAGYTQKGNKDMVLFWKSKRQDKTHIK